MKSNNSQHKRVIRHIDHLLSSTPVVPILDTVILKFPNRLEGGNRISFAKLLRNPKAKITTTVEPHDLYFEPAESSTKKTITRRELGANRWLSCLDYHTFQNLVASLHDTNDKIYLSSRYEYSKPGDRIIYRLVPEEGKSRDQALFRVLALLQKNGFNRLNRMTIDVKLFVSGNSFITFTTSHPDYRLTLHLNDILQQDVLIDDMTWLQSIARHIALVTSLCYERSLETKEVMDLLASYDCMPDRKNVLVKLNRIDLAFFLDEETSGICRDAVLELEPTQEEHSLYLNRHGIIYYPKDVQLLEQKIFKKGELLNIKDKLELRMNTDFLKKTLQVKFSDLDMHDIRVFIDKYHKQLNRRMRGLLKRIDTKTG
jgi:hypothetical protein